MYDEPRVGTEAYLVKQEAERRKKIAKDKKLDQLLVDTYFDCLKFYPAWISNGNKRWLHPMVLEAKTIGERYGNDIEFKMGEKTYKITRGDSWSPEYGEGTWYKLTLSVDNKKAFEITEEETSDQYTDYHRPVSINAYSNDVWASDFQKIIAHKKKVSAETDIEFAEDPKRVQELKEAFGIGNVSGSEGVPATKTSLTTKSIWSKWWFWVGIVIFLYLLNH